MRGHVLAALLAVGLAGSLRAQEKDRVQLELDPSVRSGSVHVKYFLVGGFGGYGDYLNAPLPADAGIFLPIYRNAQRAKSLKAVIYARGCEIATSTLDPIPSGLSRIRFACRKLRTVWLKGMVSGYPRPADLSIKLTYMAHWSHAYFQIMDGAVLSFQIVEVAPDAAGRFTVEVPDFANDPITNSYRGQAEWQIIAWKTGTDDRYWLNADTRPAGGFGSLPFERQYPQLLRFTAKLFR